MLGPAPVHLPSPCQTQTHLGRLQVVQLSLSMGSNPSCGHSDQLPNLLASHLHLSDKSVCTSWDCIKLLAYKHSKNASCDFFPLHYSLSPQAHYVPGKLLLIHKCAISNIPSSRKPSWPPRLVSCYFLGLLLPQVFPLISRTWSSWQGVAFRNRFLLILKGPMGWRWAMLG